MGKPVAKRKVALLVGQQRNEEAIRALNEILELSPTDAEAWAEMADLYLKLSLYLQAAFCLEEVLLIHPNAWNEFDIET